MPNPKMTLPNIMGGLRFFLAFVLIAIAWYGEPTIFITVLIVAFLLDAFDGRIARYLHQSSEQGARLDTVADFSVYTALVIGVFLLWPAIFRHQIVFISLAAASMLIPFLFALIKFQTFTSYHTWLVKFATVCIATGSIVLIIGGPTWPFHFASIISVIGGVEQILISLVLSKPKSDVQHLFAVLKNRDTV